MDESIITVLSGHDFPGTNWRVSEYCEAAFICFCKLRPIAALFSPPLVLPLSTDRLGKKRQRLQSGGGLVGRSVGWSVVCGGSVVEDRWLDVGGLLRIDCLLIYPPDQLQGQAL